MYVRAAQAEFVHACMCDIHSMFKIDLIRSLISKFLNQAITHSNRFKLTNWYMHKVDCIFGPTALTHPPDYPMRNNNYFNQVNFAFKYTCLA